jgi:hypothetical protein
LGLALAAVADGAEQPVRQGTAVVVVVPVTQQLRWWMLPVLVARFRFSPPLVVLVEPQ